MPILLKSDYEMKLPTMHKVMQTFEIQESIDSIAQLDNEIKKKEISNSIKPGQNVAVSVGSRGIHNIDKITKKVVDLIKNLGANPFILSAMGSHGGGTEEGQRQVLESYNITEETMGVPVITQVDVIEIGKISTGQTIYFDTIASTADAIVPINRIKMHTDFVDDIQSGLCKMLVIGLGNHIGCSSMHEEDFSNFGNILKEASKLIIEKFNVPFGVGIVENAKDETCHLELISGEIILDREKELLQIAIKNMPRLMIPEIDVLIVEEIGKDISGAGYDPNILGKSYILDKYILPVPKINKMVLLDISEASHGNAVGMGIFDVTTKKVFEQLDYESIYANGIAVKSLEDCKIPLIAEDEREATIVAIKALRNIILEDLKMVKIKNTLDLSIIEVSDALLEYVKSNDKLTLV